MRRILPAAAILSALALGAPDGASAAQHASARHHAHHARHRSRHAVQAHVIRFGAAPAATVPATVPGSPPAGAEETVGTVSSFEGGVLTITLHDHSTVSGKVTEGTEIGCRPATPSGGSEDDGAGGGSSSPQQGGGSGGPPVASARMSDVRSGSGQGDEGQQGQEGDQGGQDGGGSSCTTAALVPGAVVAEAELSLSGAGAVWDHIELIQ